MDEKISIIVFFSIVAVLRPRSHVKTLLNCYRIKNMLKFIHRVIIDWLKQTSPQILLPLVAKFYFIMFDFLKKLFGTKSEKDIKNLESKVEEINAIYTSLNTVSNDELRAKSEALKISVAESMKTQTDKINAIKEQIEADSDIDVNLKEELYKEIDEIEKEITDKLEEAITEALPEAFAILKETARRFKENT